MNLTKLAIKRPVSTVLILVAIVVFGVFSIFSFPQELTPNLEMPMFIISTVYPGASPEDVEELITSKIEEGAGTLNGVNDIIAYSMENVSILVIRYAYGTDMDKSYNDLKKKLDGFVNDFPETATTPVIMEMDVNAQDSMTLTVGGNLDQNLLNYVNDVVAIELERLSNVASVSISGGREDYIRVELQPELLKQYNLDLSTVISCISTADFAYPAGSTIMGDQSLAVSSGMDYKSVESLRNIPIPAGPGVILHLSDVANVYDAQKDASNIGRYSGDEVISLGVQKQQSASAVDVSKNVQKVINRLMENNPGLDVQIIYDSSDMIQDSLSSVTDTLVLGVVISMVILFLFFGDFKASLIVGSSIPISLMVTFCLMKVMGFSLNIVSMSSLVIGVGMMVDNSIVVLDSCFQSQLEKISYKDAGLKGTKIVTSSIIASTVTTCVVFLPLAFMQGMSGQLFEQLGFTVVFSMIASLLSAMTVVPLAYAFYKPKEKKSAPATKPLSALERAYVKALKGVLPRKKTVVAVSILLLVTSFGLAGKVGMELMPEIDAGVVQLAMELRPGVKLEKTDEVLRSVEAIVEANENVEHYLSVSGSSGLDLSGGGVSVTAYLKKDRTMTTDELIDFWQKETMSLPDCDITITSVSSFSMGATTAGVQVDLQSPDYDSLKATSNEIVKMLNERDDLNQVRSSLDNAAPLVKVEIDPVKSAAEGLTPIQIASSLNTILSGKEAATITKDGKEISVMVEYPKDQYNTIEKLESISFPSPFQKMVPITDVAEIAFKDSPQRIAKQNGQYTVNITAIPIPEAKKTAPEEVKKQVAEMGMPSDVHVAENMDTEMQNEEFASLYTAILIAIFLVFIVMAMQFESPKFSTMVMLCIPFSLIGSFGLLYLSGSTLSMTSLLGFLMLIGTVVNNGILFVDTTNQLREEMSVEEALVETGRIRLRPILMTTLTTALSMIPMALGIGSGSEMMQGLAVVVIGGLMASMVLSLLMLPTFYLIFEGKKAKKAKKTDRLKEEVVVE